MPNRPYFRVQINPAPARNDFFVLFAGESQTEPLHIMGPGVHDYYLIHFALSGRGFFECRGKRYDLTKGGSFFIFPGELFKYGSDREDPWKYRWVALKGTAVEKLLKQAGIAPDRPIHQAGPRTGSSISRLYRDIQRALRRRDAQGDLRAEACAKLLIAEYMRDRPVSPPAEQTATAESQKAVEYAVRWLTLQYHMPVAIGDMAAQLGYHRTHFTKLFKRYTGMSPLQYLTSIRMEHAKTLLNEPLSVQEVAAAVGYADALYFSRQFKKWHGCAPEHFRAKFRKRSEPER